MRDRDHKGTREDMGGELCVHDLDFGDGFVDVYTCQIISNCAL